MANKKCERHTYDKNIGESDLIIISFKSKKENTRHSYICVVLLRKNNSKCKRKKHDPPLTATAKRNGTKEMVLSKFNGYTCK